MESTAHRFGERVSVPIDRPTLAAFARANTVALARFAYLICGDRQTAEDLVQDAFVALYRRFGEQLPLDSPVAYARRAIVNANTSRTRKRGSAVTLLAELPERSDEVRHDDERDAMWRTLATLPDRQRAVLVLRYYLDLSDHDIADALDCRAGTVRSLAARAFAALREHPDLSVPGGTR